MRNKSTFYIIFPEKNKISFQENIDYEFTNFDKLDWNSLINKTNNLNKLDITITALTPNNHLTGLKTTSILNSSNFVDLTDLSTIKIPNSDKQNTKNLLTLKNNITKHVNNYLSSITNKDWYVLNGDEEIKKLLISDTNSSTSGSIKIVATDDSINLFGSTNLWIENSIINPFDLGEISIPNLSINSNNKAIVWESIYQWTKDYMEKNYSEFKLDADYVINIKDEYIIHLSN